MDPSLGDGVLLRAWIDLDESPVPLGSAAAHEPVERAGKPRHINETTMK
ncbi:hypothetical protein [Desulfurococcus amylolyticus]|nr:hypothetical protein [Desulfurococcus amylolyticus]